MKKPILSPPPNVPDLLDDRSKDIFKTIVETYLGSGEPLGSRNLAKQLSVQLSPASVRNVMADLENLGLIYSPHTSAGRMPTQSGLRYFIDGFMEYGNLTKNERSSIEAKVRAAGDGKTLDNVLTEASQLLSGLTNGAGLVIAGKQDVRLKHIEFVRLEPTKALVVIVGEHGEVENRLLALPTDMSASTLVEASNYLNTHVAGRTLSQAREELKRRHNAARAELDELTRELVEQGIAVWAGTSEDEPEQLIVRGHANLLDDLSAVDDLDRVKQLFGELESKQGMMQLLDITEEGEGVKVFIGSENKLFSLSGSSVVVSPFRDSNQRILGAVGVIGPTRLNYARIVPMVDYTAQVVSQMLQEK